MFSKVLVANRGEIAVRVIRACRDLGLKTVAVYSEADREALHVRLADEAFPIGPAPAVHSYLHIPNIINAAVQTGAEAIHPGYGFLSENHRFAEVCGIWGLTFIGPPPSAIELMGVKARARDTVAAAGVPVVPGSEGTVSSPEEAHRLAEAIGYPLLVKASAGGGGRGIRVVESREELADALERAAREAQSAFGNGELYLEKYLRQPRHIEIQVMADAHGHVVALGERESSIQRRRQKVLEEAPSAAVTPELRRAMEEAACRAAAAVGYTSAGTLEFLLDADGHFYFMEMNTRIQVEHAVTEMVTGVDLVREQIRVAAGEPLSFTQDDIRLNGWSIECRINAEDPEAQFRPSPGVLTEVTWPGGPWVRVDAGVEVGSEVQPFYDSLLAKIVVWGATRDEAVARMRRALAECRLSGVQTTKAFHEWLLSDEDFRAGRIHTQFLSERIAGV